MTPESYELHDMTTKLEHSLKAKLGLGRGDFAKRMARAGRRLPRHVHRDAQLITDAMALQGNPRIGRQVSMPTLSAAEERIQAHLARIDRADQRKGFVLGMLGGLAFNILLAAGLFIALLLWRGYL